MKTRATQFEIIEITANEASHIRFAIKQHLHGEIKRKIICQKKEKISRQVFIAEFIDEYKTLIDFMNITKTEIDTPAEIQIENFINIEFSNIKNKEKRI